MTGPFEPWSSNPILTQRDLDGRAAGAVTCTGHADLVIGPEEKWWAVFLACRPLPGGFWLTGRETFLLPVQWTEDGWPVILPRGERVPLQALLPAQARRDVSPAPPASGAFEWRDEFKSPALSPAWFTLRTSAERLWHLGADGLALAPRADRLSGKGLPALLARRVQHARFEATARVRVPTQAGVLCGVTLFQSEAQHDFFAVQRTPAGIEAIVERCDSGTLKALATVAVATDGTWIDLRITYDAAKGVIEITRNGRVLGSWTDPDPIKTGKDFSIGTCLTKAAFKDIHVRPLP